MVPPFFFTTSENDDALILFCCYYDGNQMPINLLNFAESKKLEVNLHLRDSKFDFTKLIS